MKIVTFNIRLDNGQDGKNNFCNRRDLILEKLRSEQPDIICFQEVLPHVAAWLKENLTDYYIVGCGRDERLRDEQTAIAYRRQRMNLMRLEVYWLSETPEVPASRYPDQSICPRVCTEAVFEELETGLVFRVANTHLDHEGPEARKKGLAQILKHLAGETFFAAAPVILAGDMNAEPDSEEMAVMKEHPEFTDLTSGIGVTYHGYRVGPHQCHIDYMFVSGGLVCRSVEKWTDQRNGVFLSDHYPVCAVLSARHGKIQDRQKHPAAEQKTGTDPGHTNAAAPGPRGETIKTVSLLYEKMREKAEFTLKILDANGNTAAVSQGRDAVRLVYDAEYAEGDTILLESSKKEDYVWLQFDDAVGASLCFLKTNSLRFTIPFGEKRDGYSPRAFAGEKHYLYVRAAREDEVLSYRNLAVNGYDQHEDLLCYPHAHANTETRGEAVFAARNAIDGVCENRSHGKWPYESWGINRRDDAEITVYFGREVEVYTVVLYTRADFPHDNWWKQVTLSFSDGTSLDWPMEKSILPHTIPIGKRRISWVKLSRLIRSDDPSPFPALSQIEVYGRDLLLAD